MDLIFGIIAFVALLLAFRLRKGVQGLEQRLKQVETSLEFVADGLAELRGRAGGAAKGEPPKALEGPPPREQPVLPPEPAKIPPEEVPAEPPPVAGELPSWAAQQVPSVTPAARPKSLEELLGTQWAVWVGGAAVSLGTLLLVRHSIEQGWFGPEARLAMGAVLALALIAAGEWLRRRERLAPIEGMPTAHIPSMLTATGTIAAFGTAYAAHGVYGFIGPAVTFVLLGAIAIATMLLAALHGPALAGLGLAGSIAVPLLVVSDRPAPYPVVVYLLVVAAAAYTLARVRAWLWLAVAAVAGVLLWTGAFLLEHAGAAHASWLTASYIHLGLQGAIAAAILAIEPHLGTADEEARIDLVATGVLGAIAVATVGVLAARDVGIAPYAVFALVVAAVMIATGLASLPAVAGAPLAGAIAVAALVLWPKAALPPPARDTGMPMPPPPSIYEALPRPEDVTTFLVFGSIATLVIACAAGLRLLAGRRVGPGIAGSLAAATLPPLLGLVVAYARAVRFETSYGVALAAALLALGFTLAAERFLAAERGEPAPAVRLGTGALASAAIAALSLALIALLERGFLTVALALTALGTAFVATRRDIPALRYVVAAIGIAVLARLAWDPLIMSTGPGSTVVFNWLLFGYGVPAVAFWAAGRLLAAKGDVTTAQVCQSLAILLAALLGLFEIRHAFHGDKMLVATPTHAEVGLIMVAGLGFAATLIRLDALAANSVYRVASMVLACLAAIAGLASLAVVANPLLVADRVQGPAIASSLAIGYAAPALAALVLKEVASGRRPAWFVRASGFLALLLVFGYVTLEVRHVFQGPSIALWRATGEPEKWAYSAAWLALGSAFLGWGVVRGSKEARLASLIVVVMAVLKVFLIDLADLKGIWRPLSLIGLGLVLLAIALVYQRLIFAHPRTRPGTSPAEPPKNGP